MKIIILSILALYFLYKLLAGIYVYYKVPQNQLDKSLPGIKKQLYAWGTIEHLAFVLMIIYLFFKL